MEGYNNPDIFEEKRLNFLSTKYSIISILLGVPVSNQFHLFLLIQFQRAVSCLSVLCWYIFMTPCLQHIMVTFLLWNWSMDITHLNSFFFNLLFFLSFHLLTPFHLNKIYLPIAYYLSFIYILSSSSNWKYMIFKLVWLIHLTLWSQGASICLPVTQVYICGRVELQCV